MIEGVKNRIRSKGYWRIIIRPVKESYLKDRFNKDELIAAIERAKINIRGWPYPYINYDQISYSEGDRVTNYLDYNEFKEYWDFASSGQFSHLIALREDYYLNDNFMKEINFRVLDKNKLNNAKCYLEIVSTLYQITEIFLFSSRLFLIKNYANVENVEIIIELRGIKNRMLFFADPLIIFQGVLLYDGRDDFISFSNIFNKNSLFAKPKNLALDCSVKLFQRFNWLNPNRQMLEEYQRKIFK